MAKKSAKSKGFRKTVEKKPYLSKRDIVILCVLVVLVAVAAVLLFTYDDGALKTKGGQVVDAGENWVIVNGSASNGHRYYKLAELGEYEGYTRERQAVTTDSNIYQFTYKADDENARAATISVNGAAVNAERYESYFTAMLGEDNVETATGREGTLPYFVYNHAYHEAEEGEAEADAHDQEEEGEAEAEPNRFEQVVYAFADTAHNGSVGVVATVRADSEADYMSGEELFGIVDDFLNQAVKLEAE